jgi:GTPase SAR1 family protein
MHSKIHPQNRFEFGRMKFAKVPVPFLKSTISSFPFRDTSGQGRFCTIFRSYSRGAQGILLVYDITNKWSFDGIDRWIKEVDEVSHDET